jgi:excisionase family DNA binding protein
MSRVDRVVAHNKESHEPIGPSLPRVEVAELSGRLVVSVREAASLLGISKDLAYELVRREELPSLRLGRRVVVPTRRLLELVGAGPTAAAQPSNEQPADRR